MYIISKTLFCKKKNKLSTKIVDINMQSQRNRHEIATLQRIVIF